MLWPLYLPLKLVVYALVARYGLRSFQPLHQRPWVLASAVSVVRALVGFGIAIPIAGASYWLQSVYDFSRYGEVGFYLLAYVIFYLPLRWVAWSIVAPLVNPTTRSLRAVLLCSGGNDAKWRAVGVLASCSVDLLLVAITGTVPIGKFFC